MHMQTLLLAQGNEVPLPGAGIGDTQYLSHNDCDTQEAARPQEDIVLALSTDHAVCNDAWQRLRNAALPMVEAVVRRIVRNPSDAEDVVQNVFIAAFLHLPVLKDHNAFFGWMRSIAQRHALHAVTRNRVMCALYDAPERVADRQATFPGAAMERAEDQSAVRKGLRTMKALDRRALEQFYVEGMSLKQMADANGSPIGTEKRRLHTARKRLKDTLAAYSG